MAFRSDKPTLQVENRQARIWEIVVGDFIIETITVVCTSDAFNPAWIRRVNPMRLIVTRIHYVIWNGNSIIA